PIRMSLAVLLAIAAADKHAAILRFYFCFARGLVVTTTRLAAFATPHTNNLPKGLMKRKGDSSLSWSSGTNFAIKKFSLRPQLRKLG
ncbi:MAG TPA: hypothetical protein VNV88_04710, partial [Candidatus Solibacter sp.]|nr:hypothetical protein [Candidatus Solibacter sp.]